MTRDASPKKKSLERRSTFSKKDEAGFSYDRPTKSAQHRMLASQQVYSAGAAEGYSPTNKASPAGRRSPMNGRRSKPDPNAWKGGAQRPGAQPNGGLSPHRAYVPPALAKQHQNTDIYQATAYSGGSALDQRASGAGRPDLPQKLVDEFKTPPRNYAGLISALHDEEAFAAVQDKWK